MLNIHLNIVVVDKLNPDYVYPVVKTRLNLLCTSIDLILECMKVVMHGAPTVYVSSSLE